MASKMLDTVLNAEKVAAAAELSAKNKADEKIAVAKQQAEDKVMSAQLRSQEKTKESLNKAQDECTLIEKTAIQAAQEEGQILINAARKKQNAAVDAVKDYIFPKY